MIATPVPPVQPEGKLFFYIALTERIGDILTLEIVGTIFQCSHTGTLYLSPSIKRYGTVSLSSTEGD